MLGDRDRPVVRFSTAIFRNIVGTWQFFKACEPNSTFRHRVLSLLPFRRDLGVTREMVFDMLTLNLPVDVGMEVWYLHEEDSRWVRAAVAQVHRRSGADEVESYDLRTLTKDEVKTSPLLALQPHQARRVVNKLVPGVAPDRVEHIESVVCTRRDYDAARYWQQAHGPAFPEEEVKNDCFTRTAMEQRKVTLDYILNTSKVVQADGGKKAASRGVKFLVKGGMRHMLNDINDTLKGLCQKLITMGALERNVGPGYKKMANVTTTLCMCVSRVQRGPRAPGGAGLHRARGGATEAR